MLGDGLLLFSPHYIHGHTLTYHHHIIIEQCYILEPVVEQGRLRRKAVTDNLSSLWHSFGDVSGCFIPALGLSRISMLNSYPEAVRVETKYFGISATFIILRILLFWGRAPGKSLICVLCSFFEHSFKGAFAACLLLARLLARTLAGWLACCCFPAACLFASCYCYCCFLLLVGHVDMAGACRFSCHVSLYSLRTSQVQRALCSLARQVFR